MNFHVFLVVLSTFFISFSALSQCVPDETYIPVSSNYGLSPDTLVDGAMAQPYFQELTFYLPLDTLVEVDGFGENLIEFVDYHITSITLPIGMTWECNNSEDQCHYDPTISQYGCVVLGGTPFEFGEFDVEVTVEATHTLSWLAGTEIISFNLPLTILPNQSSNEGFSMANFSGCTPLSVEFINNNTGLAAYSWDFGNGNINSSENPPAQLYSEPGTYVVSYSAYSTAESIYTLQSVVINGSDNWYDFGDDGTSMTPDHFFYILNQEGVVVYSSVVQDNVDLPASFNDIGLNLVDDNYSIEVWDDDTYFVFGVELGTDDNLGSLSFNSSSSNISANGLSISFDISEIPPILLTENTDTVYVYENPSQPTISYDDIVGELILDLDTQNVSYQWHQDQTPLLGSTASSHTPEHSAFYSVMVTNEYGCIAFSNEEMVIVCDDEFMPQISLSNDTLFADVFINHIYEWSYNNEILDQDGEVCVISQEGQYSLTLIDEWGCEYKSNEVVYNIQSVNEFNQSLQVYPNPTDRFVILEINTEFTSGIIEVYNLQGQKVLSQILDKNTIRLDLDKFDTGVYYLNVNIEGSFISRKLFIN